MLPEVLDEALAPSERRQSERKKLNVKVDFEGGVATGIANTRDIGIGGLYMTTGTDFEVGTRVRMRLTLSGQEISLAGTIVYTDPGQGAGVRFQNLSEADRTLLENELSLK